MSWGDPFDKLYKDDDHDARRRSLVEDGFVPGIMVHYGTQRLSVEPGAWVGGTCHVWSEPDFKSDGWDVCSGIGIVLGVTADADPINNWLLILINTPDRKLFGWLPTNLVRKLS